MKWLWWSRTRDFLLGPGPVVLGRCFQRDQCPWLRALQLCCQTCLLLWRYSSQGQSQRDRPLQAQQSLLGHSQTCRRLKLYWLPLRRKDPSPSSARLRQRGFLPSTCCLVRLALRRSCWYWGYSQLSRTEYRQLKASKRCRRCRQEEGAPVSKSGRVKDGLEVGRWGGGWILCLVWFWCGAYKALAAPVLMVRPPAGPLAERVNDMLRATEEAP